MQKPHRGKGREDETQTSQGPQKTNVGLGHQDQKAAEEQGFKEHPTQNLRTCNPGFEDSINSIINNLAIVTGPGTG